VKQVAEMSEPLRVISLGWGVQSFALAAMSALGVLPPVDAAIHADTTHERSETYVFAARWTAWLEARGVKVVTVSAKAEQTDIKTGRTPPLFTLSDAGDRGQLRRTCTHRWKVLPQERWIRAELARLGLPRRQWHVEKWYGITRDEWHRMKDSDVRYITNRYPFMEMEPPWRRSDVVRWLLDNDLEVPVKSACTFCPFHNLEAWRDIKANGNGDWQKALDADRAIRDKRPGYKCYIHPARIPLEDVDLRNQEDHGQLRLWDEEECSGTCFL
jgi:hypothetical protein